jgi:hypothetical protein
LAPYQERDIVLLPPGSPRAVGGVIAGFVARHLRFERLSLGEPLVLRREGKRKLETNDVIALEIDAGLNGKSVSAKPHASLDARSVAALSIEFAIAPAAPFTASLEIHGSADRHATLHAVVRDRIAVVPLERQLQVLSLGGITRIDLDFPAPTPTVVSLSALGALPTIAVVAPQSPADFAGDPPPLLEFAFRPPFACDQYRVAVVIGSTTLLSDGLSADRIERNADGVFTLRFEQNRLAGRPSTIDWRWVHYKARGRYVRWFIEGVTTDGVSGKECVSCRSPFYLANVR